MHQIREDLDIVFRRTAPEIVLNGILSKRIFSPEKKMVAEAERYGEDAYCHYAPLNMAEYSPDEIEFRYGAMQSRIAGRQSIFYMLTDYADRVLVSKNGVPVCKLEEALNWNSITKRLGQDIFITSWLALQNLHKKIGNNLSFTWQTVIKTDDQRLYHLLSKGLSENHYHLNGSTQVLSLSWASLMNHPQKAGAFLQGKNRFNENLSINISRGEADNVMSWRDRLLYAAMIRSCLTKRCHGIMKSCQLEEEFCKFALLPLSSTVENEVETLRYQYGVKFKQPDHSWKCLDYANNPHMYQIDPTHYNRLPAGERSFLYHCFARCFSKEFTPFEASLFYLYLLIKSNFTGELIQNNNRVGFRNFADYQDRKSQLFEEMPEYKVEAYRLSVRTNLEENNIKTLEARIMIRQSSDAIRKYVREVDDYVCFSDTKREEWPYFLVFHFPKSKFVTAEYNKSPAFLYPRNRFVRKKAKRAAIGLKNYIRLYEKIETKGDMGQRVFGIDACSNEIGCRPETFATEFRYLRNGDMWLENVRWDQSLRKDFVNLRATYHVGEDFLDVADGLRAIDEAVRYLQLTKGDRLGHALVLGIDTAAYYAGKRYSICLSKQDYLDDLVWILYRSLELDIYIDANRRDIIKKKAQELLYEIYLSDDKVKNAGKDFFPGDILGEYYQSWCLRGDHPDLYRSGKYIKSNEKFWDEYESCMVNGKEPDHYRCIPSVVNFLFLYHFDAEVKTKSLEPVFVEWDNWLWYAELMSLFQQKMREKIAGCGIAIECNPTSNVLIGTFKRYDSHPILQFNQHRLSDSPETANILTSINTDDIGVFDTSLENEYALLLCALKKARHLQGIYNDDMIYDYLDNLRECGLNMSFRKLTE